MLVSYPLINRDQNAGLCVFRRQYITVDGHSPPLIPTDLDVTIHAIDEGCKFRSEQKDVDAAEDGYAVEGLDDCLLEGAGVEVGNHVSIDIHSGATLVMVLWLVGLDILEGRSGVVIDYTPGTEGSRSRSYPSSATRGRVSRRGRRW